MLPAKSTWANGSVGRSDFYHLFTFDPGGIIGWAHFVITPEAFTNPTAKVLRHLVHWDCGEFTGTETAQLKTAVVLIDRVRIYNHARLDVVGEDFELTQLIGGKQLLSPVRINAVLDWELGKLGIPYQLQSRNMRTSVTRERLRLFGFQGKWTTTGAGKDAFAAMQHGVTWLRRVKQQSLSKPWTITDAVTQVTLDRK